MQEEGIMSKIQLDVDFYFSYYIHITQGIDAYLKFKCFHLT